MGSYAYEKGILMCNARNYYRGLRHVLVLDARPQAQQGLHRLFDSMMVP